jgi:hypothetical protein
MRSFMKVVGLILALAASGASADDVGGRLIREWPKLAGTWVMPFRKAAEGGPERRLRLTLRKSGADRLFEEYEETRSADGKTARGFVHSAVMVVVAIREKGDKQYLVVRPKSEPSASDTEIQYEFVNERLKLQGSLGSSNLTGQWSRL